VLRRYPELTSYDEAHRLLHSGAPFRGPDGVEVAVWHAVSSKVWMGWPALPSRWRRSRVEWLFAMAGYFVSLPLKPMPFREIHSATWPRFTSLAIVSLSGTRWLAALDLMPSSQRSAAAWP
jgi:hypothetical protein